MPNDFDANREPLEVIVRRLTAMVVQMDGYMHNQERVNERLDASIEELKGFNREQVALNHRLETTLGRLETRMERIVEILERSLPGSTNGREASP